MFTEEDYLEYFRQIARVERKMIYGSYELAGRMGVSRFSGILHKIGQDEVRHYGYVLKLFELISGGRSKEQRIDLRDNCLATLLLRGREGREVKGYCVNLSREGVCLECYQDLKPGEEWELEIRLLNKSETTIRHGRTVWSKEVEPGFFMAGVNFIE